ncbi:MAG: glycosyltransferase [Casimicrobiaceae bacterium]
MTPVPSPAAAPRIAIVHDWLDTWRGGENVLAEILRLYPHAALYALVDFLPDRLRNRLGGRRASTSFLQRIPGARRHFRALLPLFPRAIESLDLSAFDTIISVSHAVAKGVRVRPGQRHLCYCLTPMRYAWDLRDAYFPSTSARTLLRPLADRMLDRLRDWDRATSIGVTEFAAISHFIAERIARHYARPSRVIYPPVDTHYFTPGDDAPARDYYLAASRWVPYKRIDAIVAAFARMPARRLIVAGDGPDASRVRAAALAAGNVTFVGEAPREQLRDLMRGARAFVFAAEEDFGIMPLESQACGTPVIAYGRGGAVETLGVDGGAATAVFFDQQSPSAIADAVQRFESEAALAGPADCRANALRFETARFCREFVEFAGMPAVARSAAAG